MNNLIIGDVHADLSSLEELETIFQEIYYSCKEKYNGGKIIFLGDIINHTEKRPHPEVLVFVTKLITDMTKNSEVIVCIGNHESWTDDKSTLDYLKYLNVNLIYHHGTIKIGEKIVYLGHHFLDQSDEHYKDNRFKVKELTEKYDFCLIGHDHKFRQHNEKFINLGSIRRTTFNEVDYGMPKYAKMSTESLKIELCEVKSATPMLDVTSIDEALKHDYRTKLRLVFKSFEEYMKNVNKLPELGKKFFMFKVFHDYIQKVNKVKKEVKKGKSFKEMFGEFLNKEVKNKEVKTLIEENL